MGMYSSPYTREQLLSAAYEGLKANGYVVGSISKPEVIHTLEPAPVLPAAVQVTDWYGQFKAQKVVDSEYHGRGLAQTVYVRIHLRALSGGPQIVDLEESPTRFDSPYF